jgi:hypothetical protein
VALSASGCTTTAAQREGGAPEAQLRVNAPMAAPRAEAVAADERRAPPAALEAPAAAVNRAVPERPDSEQADTDPANDLIVAPPEPLDDCSERLRGARVEFSLTSFPLDQKRGDVFTCGTEQAVVYRKGPEALRWNARPHVTCRMALALARFEQVVQEEATAQLGKRVRRVTQGGTYSCRKMQRFANMVSEHSYANAIDIRSLELEGGKTVSVLAHFGPLDTEPTRPESLFLRSVARRLYDENVFSVVLTPHFDALHRDHFHLDLARYRLDGTR